MTEQTVLRLQALAKEIRVEGEAGLYDYYLGEDAASMIKWADELEAAIAAAVPSSPTQEGTLHGLEHSGIHSVGDFNRPDGMECVSSNSPLPPQHAIELLRRWQAEDAALPAEPKP